MSGVTYLEATQLGNLTISDTFLKANTVLGRHSSIAVSISGGSDSDIITDIVQTVVPNLDDLLHKVDVSYIFIDTGIEYVATREHVRELESKYGIEVKRLNAAKPIPTCCKEYGTPFLSKYVSGMIERLQRHGFKWEDEPFDVLYERYPSCKAALRWWTNDFMLQAGTGKHTRFDIAQNRLLKEFMVENPPSFGISAKCCSYAKKKPSTDFIKSNWTDLLVTGVRRSEGGARAMAYKTCFTDMKGGCDQYRPIWYWKDDDKSEYERMFGVTHSRCYTEYGLTRTGCVGCPFNRQFDAELETVRLNEPKLLKLCERVFGESYEYTRRYREFAKAYGGQMELPLQMWTA